MSQILDLTQIGTRPEGNVTLACGLVCVLQEPSGRPALSALEGHSDCTVFVFHRKSGRLIRTLDAGQSVGVGESWMDWLRGLEYAAFAVSARQKRVIFVSDFHCADVALKGVGISLDIMAANPRDIAVDVLQGTDPVLGLCESFKVRLSRELNSLRLPNIYNLSEFNRQVFATFDRLQVSSAAIRVVEKEISIVPPKVISESREARLAHESNLASQRARLEIQGMDLDWAGVKDPHMKLLLLDLAGRSSTLNKLLDHRIEQAGHEGDRANQVLQRKLEMVSGFLRNQVTDQTTVEEVERLLRMLDGAESSESTHPGFKILDGRPSAGRALPAPQGSADPPGRELSRFRIIPARAAPVAEPAPAKPSGDQAEPSPSETGPPAEPKTPIASRPPRFKPTNQEPLDDDAI